MNFDQFKQNALISMEEICRETFRKNQVSIKIKKEAVAVKNLSNIFDCALRLSNEKGFPAMSLRDLSRESGLSMGALYSYFTSKEDLLEMIQDQGRRLTWAILSQWIDPLAAPNDRLRAAIRSHLYLTEMMHPWFYFSYMETKNLNKEQQKKSIGGELATEQLFADILESGSESGIFSVDRPRLAAAAIKALLQDWYVKRWKYSRRRITVDAYADFVIAFVESAVRGRGAAGTEEAK